MAKPFIEEKDVILCRSGIQIYRSNELVGLNLVNDMPSCQASKTEYRIMRHKAVLVLNKDKFRRLTLCREHPPVDVTPQNWKQYAEGSTGSLVDVVNLEGGEIGLQSDLVFNTNDIYNYYLEGNKEVSVGYTNTHRWIDNPEERGYDIELVDINEVNHLAVTRMGRGGSQVSIIDSLIGGIRMLKMKSGIFGFLGKKGGTKDSVTPFSKTVFDSLKKVGKMSEKEVETMLATLTDSLGTLRETDTRKVLCDSIADLVAEPALALQKEDELVLILDSLYAKAEAETVGAFDSAYEKPKDAKDESTDDSTEDATEDSKGEPPMGDPKKESTSKEDPKKEVTKDEDGKGKGTMNISDSLVAALDSMLTARFDAFANEFRESYGLPKLAKKPGGTVTKDSTPVSEIKVIDYID